MSREFLQNKIFVLALKVHKLKTTDQNLCKSSENIRKYISIICRKF